MLNTLRDAVGLWKSVRGCLSSDSACSRRVALWSPDLPGDPACHVATFSQNWELCGSHTEATYLAHVTHHMAQTMVKRRTQA